MTSNFIFTNITWCKSRSNCKYMEAQVGITVNFVFAKMPNTGKTIQKAKTLRALSSHTLQNHIYTSTMKASESRQDSVIDCYNYSYSAILKYALD